MAFRYYFFGSHDSTDKDVLVEVPTLNMENREEAYQLIEEIKAENEIAKTWNLNPIVIENQIITKCHPSKGTPDNTHNALFHTYHLHDQDFPLPLHSPVERNRLLCYYRCLRTVLTQLTRTNLRPIIKPILNGIHPFEAKKAILPQIHFHFDTFSQKYQSDVHTWKILAFYLGQANALHQEIEIYTKQALVAYNPLLEPFIYRQSFTTIHLEALHQAWHTFVEMLLQLPIENPAQGILHCGNEKISMISEQLI